MTKTTTCDSQVSGVPEPSDQGYRAVSDILNNDPAGCVLFPRGEKFISLNHLTISLVMFDHLIVSDYTLRVQIPTIIN